MRTRSLLLGTLAVAFLVGMFEPPYFFPSVGWFFIGCAAANLVAAAVLAAGGGIPEWWGRTALGQALLSEGSLTLGILMLAGHTITPSVGWPATAIGVAAFLLGLRIESRARRSASSTALDSQGAAAGD